MPNCDQASRTTTSFRGCGEPQPSTYFRLRADCHCCVQCLNQERWATRRFGFTCLRVVYRHLASYSPTCTSRVGLCSRQFLLLRIGGMATSRYVSSGHSQETCFQPQCITVRRSRLAASYCLATYGWYPVAPDVRMHSPLSHLEERMKFHGDHTGKLWLQDASRSGQGMRVIGVYMLSRRSLITTAIPRNIIRNTIDDELSDQSGRMWALSVILSALIINGVDSMRLLQIFFADFDLVYSSCRFPSWEHASRHTSS
jgi:hypothetical protein